MKKNKDLISQSTSMDEQRGNLAGEILVLLKNYSYLCGKIYNKSARKVQEVVMCTIYLQAR